jgi:tight adherence protein B
MPYSVVRFKRNKRLGAFEEMLPEAIDLLGRAIRAGHPLSAGMKMVADETKDPIAGEFRRTHEEHRFGLPFEDALLAMADRVNLIDVRILTTAILIQREVGGNLAEVLDNLASVIRERFKVKRQIRVISAHGRITGTVLAFLPPSLAAVTLLINRDHLGTLLNDPIGHRMIYTAITLQIVGTLIMRKIIRIEY